MRRSVSENGDSTMSMSASCTSVQRVRPFLVSSGLLTDLRRERCMCRFVRWPADDNQHVQSHPSTYRIATTRARIRA